MGNAVNAAVYFKNKVGNGIPMMKLNEDVWNAIEHFASEHGKTCSGLAKCSGLDPTTFNKSKRWSKHGQPRWPSTNSISKILSATGASINDFTKFIPSHEKAA
jgi:phage repressor protein C with HTH and peptisase S24 domain